jgi:hypothetical protein
VGRQCRCHTTQDATRIAISTSAQCIAAVDCSAGGEARVQLRAPLLLWHSRWRRPRQALARTPCARCMQLRTAACCPPTRVQARQQRQQPGVSVPQTCARSTAASSAC